MRILLTGGTGYIGSHTCVELLNNNHDVVIVDNLSNSNKLVLSRIERITSKRPTFYEVDLLDYEKLSEVFAKEDIDAVIHFAALKSVGESIAKPLDYYENNIAGTINLCKVMAKYNIKNIVFSSSATVYGDAKKMPISEDSPIANIANPYGQTKAMIEQILKDLYASDNDWNITILRYFNPIGAHESGLIGEDPNGIPSNLVPYIAQTAIGKRKYLHIYGDDYNTKDGTGVRDYIHVVDLSLGHLCALERNKGLNIYNLGTGIGYSVMDVVKAYEKACGSKINYKIEARRPGDIAVCYADPSLAECELKWKAKFGLDRMCEDSWRWQKMNPNGYKD